MVDQEFRKKLQNVSDALEKSRGSVELFAIFKMDELTDKWTVVVSAGWVAKATFEEIFSELRALLIKNLADDMNSIARIGIFNSSEHFAQLVTQRFASGQTIKDEQQINGNLIHEGYILKAIRQSKIGSSGF
jgi:hypothetical protein